MAGWVVSAIRRPARRRPCPATAPVWRRGPRLSDGLGEPRSAEKNLSNPSPSVPTVASQCHAVSRFGRRRSRSSSRTTRSSSKSPQRQPCVEFRVVAARPLELAVLVVLDEVMVGVAREGEGTEPERIHRRETQQAEAGLRGAEVGQVEIDEVVAQQEVRADGQAVQFAEVRSPSGYGPVDIGADSREGANTAALRVNFQVYGEAAKREAVAVGCHRRHSAGSISLTLRPGG